MRKTHFLCAAAACGLFAFGANAHADGLLGGAGGLTGGLGGSVGGLTGSVMGHGNVAGHVSGAVSRPGALDSINAERELRKAERAARKARRQAEAAAAKARARGALDSYADIEDGAVKTKTRAEGSGRGSSDLLGSVSGMARVTGAAMANEDGARARASAESRGTGTVRVAPDTGYLIDQAYETAGAAKAKAKAAKQKARQTAQDAVDTARDLKPSTSVSAAGSAAASGSGTIGD